MAIVVAIPPDRGEEVHPDGGAVLRILGRVGGTDPMLDVGHGWGGGVVRDETMFVVVATYLSIF